ncbi:tyrosinase cofactor [Kitasatospora sp. NPDC048540]|uniref:apotyrosinase chaperone MelC1 n=1 Tax=unclassified Kitasatospora TaxID=2633591 RepID=UPI000539A297|nr:tyrosinase cofactor [Kitasatospora sp. MBT63]
MPENGHAATELTRRRMLQGAGVALTAAVGAIVLGATGPADSPAAAADPGAGDRFDEQYRGRRITGAPTAGAAGGAHHHDTGYAVQIDGRELHMMRNADGTWISVINHYQTHPTPRALARAAVDDLQGADLAPLALV